MPSLNRLWEENKDKGLHIIHVESQGHTRDQVEAFCDKNGIEFPNVVGRNGFQSYEGDNGLPYAFVIGAEGKVVFQGRGNYEAAIRTELAKIRYPGLGKLTVAKPLTKAAGYFARRQYAKAIAEAEKVEAREESNEDTLVEVSADARHIVSRCHLMGQRLRAAIDQNKSERMYPEALAGLKLLGKQFKGLDVGTEADAERKSLSKDPAVKAELKAFGALAALEQKLTKVRDSYDRAEALKAFARKFEGKKAAEVALRKAGTQ